MILLVGATGRLGQAVALRLLDENIAFRATARNPAKAKWLVERGVEVVKLDFANEADLAEVMSGISKAVSCIHGLLGRSRSSIQRVDVQGQSSLIRAAARAGLERFVFISAHGASQNHPSEFWQAKAATEQTLKKAGLDYVILRPSAFMDLYADELIGAAIMRGKTAFILGEGNTTRNMIAVSDVAEATVIALSRPDLLGQTIELGGWDNITEREVAGLYAKLTGNPLKLRSVHPVALRALAALVSPLHAGIGRLLRLPLQLADCDLTLDPAASSRLLGNDPIRLREFAEAKIRTRIGLPTD